MEKRRQAQQNMESAPPCGFVENCQAVSKVKQFQYVITHHYQHLQWPYSFISKGHQAAVTSHYK